MLGLLAPALCALECASAGVCIPLLCLPLPPSALCTIFGERALPCLVTSACVSLSPCPASSGLSLFVLSWGLKGWGGGACCCGAGEGEGEGEGEGGGSSRPVPPFPLRREILAQGGSLLVSVYLVLVVLAICWPTYPSLSSLSSA